MIKSFIPNFITILNLCCGFLGIVLALEGELHLAAFAIFLASVFDFFDGMAARLLDVSSPIGKELDSLADAVSFGVLPAMMVFQFMNHDDLTMQQLLSQGEVLPFVALLIPACSAWRLARFNLETGKSIGFNGLPTPANAIFWGSLIVCLENIGIREYYWFNINHILSLLVILFSWFLVSNLKLISLKFENLSWSANKPRFILIGFSVAGLALFKIYFVPTIIIFYIGISLLSPSKKDEVSG